MCKYGMWEECKCWYCEYEDGGDQIEIAAPSFEELRELLPSWMPCYRIDK